MPCYYYETPEERAAARKEQEKRDLEGIEYTIVSLKEEMKKIKKERNKLTKLLCESMSAIEDGDENLVSEELIKWYKDHKKRDSLRKKK